MGGRESGERNFTGVDRRVWKTRDKREKKYTAAPAAKTVTNKRLEQWAASTRLTPFLFFFFFSRWCGGWLGWVIPLRCCCCRWHVDADYPCEERINSRVGLEWRWFWFDLNLFSFLFFGFFILKRRAMRGVLFEFNSIPRIRLPG